jgi:NADH dehydrogenase [ubiquinone] 1 alpha subcomplex assembly factor 7
LQHPEFGYYRHGDPLGGAGDFITAPEISQMFGEMIGLWCADVWRQMGSPTEFVLLEMGPGRGTLMQDALRATAKISGFHHALRLHFLESSETLRAVQAEKLGAFSPKYVTGLAASEVVSPSPAAYLPNLPIIAIANEFFDALPIRQFEKSFTGWCERWVTLQDGQLAFTLSPPDPAILLLIPEALRTANPGTVFELSSAAVNLIRDLSLHIAQQGGAALLVDYGYLTPDGKPSLQAVAGHRYADVLANAGEADITALVDFGMLRQAAILQGALAHGAVGQGEFLSTLGITLRADQLKLRATPDQKAAIESALHRLTDAAEMGSLFKVLAVSSPQLKQLPGF